jgi:phosphoadenosine phosphosulfate reductase
MSMWELIVKKRMPPTRIVRYCCCELKESGGQGRFVATGVRWAESVNRRKKRGSLGVVRSGSKENIILNADNDESRRLFETCMRQGKRFLNPIIEWGDGDVWELLRHYGCASNPLYQAGFSRIGCVGCPMARAKTQLWGFELYPKYKALYLHAFERMLAARRADGMPCAQWDTAEDVFRWWLEGPRNDPAVWVGQAVPILTEKQENVKSFCVFRACETAFSAAQNTQTRKEVLFWAPAR